MREFIRTVLDEIETYDLIEREWVYEAGAKLGLFNEHINEECDEKGAKYDTYRYTLKDFLK